MSQNILFKKSIGNISLVLFSILISIFFIEYLASLFVDSSFSNNDRRIKIAERIGVQYDTKTKIEYYNENSGFTFAISPSNFLEIDNQKTIPFSPSKSYSSVINCNESGVYSTYQSDRYGFNNIDSIWDFDNLDIAITGDSFVNGSCVNQENTLTNKLILKNNNLSILNVGANGNGPMLEYASLKEYLYLKKPKKVIWFYYEGNDLVNLQDELKNNFLLNYFETDFRQNLIKKQESIDSMIQEYVASSFELASKKYGKDKLRFKLRYLRLFHLRTIIKQAFSPEFENDINEVDPNFYKIFSNLLEEIKMWNGHLVFVYLPEFDRYKNNIINHQSFNNKDEIISELQEIGVETIDLHNELFMKKKNPLDSFPFGVFGHYTASTYDEIATIISNRIL